MTSSPLRVGLIGTGRISDLHAIEYLQNPDARIVALCDRDIGQARQKAQSWGIPDVAVEDDIDAFLARPDIDLVEILLPHHLHLPIALKAMAAGKIISLQKPMCLDLAEADQLVAAAEAYDRPVKIFENFIFYPPVLKARALIDSGAIGTPLSIRIKSNPARSATAWEVPAAANAWRQEAVALWRSGPPLDAEQTLRVIDALRRSESWEDAEATAGELAMLSPSEVVGHVIALERRLVAAKDAGRHTVASAWPPPARRPHATHRRRDPAAGGGLLSWLRRLFGKA